jgi:hypothetical protein
MATKYIFGTGSEKRIRALYALSFHRLTFNAAPPCCKCGLP